MTQNKHLEVLKEYVENMDRLIPNQISSLTEAIRYSINLIEEAEKEGCKCVIENGGVYETWNGVHIKCGRPIIGKGKEELKEKECEVCGMPIGKYWKHVVCQRLGEVKDRKIEELDFEEFFDRNHYERIRKLYIKLQEVVRWINKQ